MKFGRVNTGVKLVLLWIPSVRFDNGVEERVIIRYQTHYQINSIRHGRVGRMRFQIYESHYQKSMYDYKSI